MAVALYGAAEPLRASMRTRAASARPPTRQLAACAQLPLAGLGLHTVLQGDAPVREQLHVVTDARAMQLVRWPKHPSLAPLQAAVRDAAQLLHGLCAAVLREVEPAAQRQQAAQAAASGDPSVLDLFLYPNAQPISNMRTHTDPGLLTLKRASETPGLQARARLQTCTRARPASQPPPRLRRCSTRRAASGSTSRRGRRRATCCCCAARRCRRAAAARPHT
jgi:hypothetical protein